MKDVYLPPSNGSTRTLACWFLAAVLVSPTTQHNRHAMFLPVEGTDRRGDIDGHGNFIRNQRR